MTAVCLCVTSASRTEDEEVMRIHSPSVVVVAVVLVVVVEENKLAE